MAASIQHNRCFVRTWKIDGTKYDGTKINGEMRASAFSASLSAGIQISHHHTKHLPGLSRIALGNRCLRAALAAGIGAISISPRDCWQPGAPAANESRPLGNGQPRLERPIGNLPCGRA